MAGRFTKYKNKGLDCSELRRRREETGIQLRRAKREEEFIKRRFVDPDGCTIEEPSNQFGQGSINSMQELIVEVMSDDPIKQLRSTQVFRKLLSQEPSPPIEDVIQYGVVPRFVHFLQQHDNSILQFEAAWALTNVASGNSSQTRHVIDVGGIPVLLQLLSSNHDDVLEQAVWALGNIAGDSAECRDIVLQHGIMDPLLGLLQRSLKLSLVRNTVWCLSNLCRGKNPPPSFDQVSLALPTLSRLLFHHDADVLADSCWAVTHLSDGPNHKIQAVIESGICRRLVELLMHEDQNVVCAALRAVGNIVTGDDVQTQVILNCSVLPSLLHLLGKGSETLRKEVCWTISNITAGNRDQVQAVINSNIVPALVETLNVAEFQTRKEAAWAITNATCGGSPDQVRYLANVGCISPLCDLLSVSHPKIVIVALNGISNILKVGNRLGGAKKGVNPYSSQVEECFGLNKIEYLLHHENVDIANKASEILDHYFREEEPLPEEFHEFASTTTENVAHAAAVPSEGFSL